MSTTPLTSRISPLPGQEDQSARLAASAKVGQVEGTISVEPDYVVVRASELRLLRLQLSVAIERSSHGFGRVQGSAALNQLLLIEGKSIPLDVLLMKCRGVQA